jgi:hypothetical protein
MILAHLTSVLVQAYYASDTAFNPWETGVLSLRERRGVWSGPIPPTTSPSSTSRLVAIIAAKMGMGEANITVLQHPALTCAATLREVDTTDG